MFQNLLHLLKAAAPNLLVALTTAALTWIVGQRIAMAWNLRQRRREFDLETARGFHNLYGEFFAVWKLWNYLVRDVGPADLQGGSRWDLLRRACESEGRLEATFVRLSCERSLGAAEREWLGRFRQLYQSLREAIRDSRPLRWDSANHPSYRAFKELAPEIAGLILGKGASQPKPGEAAKALLDITSNRWEHVGNSTE